MYGGSRYLEPSRDMDQGSSYWEFELSGIENKGPKIREENGVYHISTSVSIHTLYIFIEFHYRRKVKENKAKQQLKSIYCDLCGFQRELRNVGLLLQSSWASCDE